MSASAAGARLTHRSARDQASMTAAPFQHWVFPDGRPWTEFHRQAAGYLLRFPGLADFCVSADGREVEAWPVPGVGVATTELLFQNQVLPLALSRQGVLVLHASAVEAEGRALAFIGASGRGKSTLAASFASSGGRFLADDGLQLQWRGESPWALPSHASVRLWPDSEAALLAPGHPAAPPAEHTSKARFLAAGTLAHLAQPRALQRLYLLGEGSAAQALIRRASAAETVRELVRHSFLLDIDEKAVLARHFDEVSRIASLGMLYHLDYPRRFDALADVRRAVLDHAQAP
jgi:hypothetical protein